MGDMSIFTWLLVMLIWAIPLILWIWAIIDIIKSDFKDQTMKIVWLLVVIFLSLLGMILYFAIGRGMRIKKTETDQ